MDYYNSAHFVMKVYLIMLSVEKKKKKGERGKIRPSIYLTINKSNHSVLKFLTVICFKKSYHTIAFFKFFS